MLEFEYLQKTEGVYGARDLKIEVLKNYKIRR